MSDLMKNSRASSYLTLAVVGALVGGLLGFLVRPSVPLTGKLPLSAVISRGANLEGMESFLRPAAQKSFSYLSLGALLGLLGGLVLAELTTGKAGPTVTAAASSTPTTVGTEPAPKARGLFEFVFLALLLVGNLMVLVGAWQDKSWGALWLAIIGGPVLNGVFLVSGLVTILFLRRRRVQFSLGRHLALTTGAPIAAIVADLLIIMSMGLHGS